MIFLRTLIRLKNNSAIILLSVLWTMVILTILAISLGRKSSIEVALAKHAMGSFRAKYLAWAGLVYTVNLIRMDSEDNKSNQSDTQYQCGVPFNIGRTPQELFQKMPLESGYFSVEYSFIDNKDSTAQTIFGPQAEEGRINLNGLNPQSYAILKSLITLLGYDLETAEMIAASAIDWQDEDSNASFEEAGAEDKYYMGLQKPYHCKNAFFDSLEELLLVRGMTPEIYSRIKPFITVFPKGEDYLINFDTAPSLVLQALAYSLIGTTTNTASEDADALIEKIVAYRKGSDGAFATYDDQVIELVDLSLNAKEKTLFLVMNQYRKKISDYMNVRIKAKDEASSVQVDVEAIIRREDLSVVYWNRH